jgi:hypothetical protein
MIVRKNAILIVNNLKEVICSKSIVMEFRTDKKYFTRKRKQPFGEMILFMLNFVKKSLVIEIDNFIQIINTKGLSVNNFSKSAFVQKRIKIKPEVFKYLSEIIINGIYKDTSSQIKLFKNFRLLAVDGSKITLPNTKELSDYFGESKNQTNTSVVQARVSTLYDVLNNFVLDSVIESLKIGERVLALRHSFKWEKNDLIIYDRGYPSYDFIYEHFKGNVNFVMRATLTYSKVVIAFVESGKTSSLVDIFPQEKHCFKGKDYNKNTAQRIRLVKVVLPSGEIEVLITSLLDSQEYPSNIFKELYFLRWKIETFYDELKNKIKVEYFTGLSKISVLQDFYCAIFISNLQSLIVNEVQEDLEIKNNNTKLNYKINTNLSYGFLKNRVLELLFKEGSAEDVFMELRTLFLNNTVPIRPERNNKRVVGKYRTRTRPQVLKNQKDAI